MSNLNDELDRIKNVQPEEQKWLNEPYVGLVQIKDTQFSEDLKVGKERKPYTGAPFFKILIATRDGERTWLIFWRYSEKSDQSKNEAKEEKIKILLDNARADATKTGREYFNSIIGNKLQMVIKKKDEWRYNKEGIPQIYSSFIYSYSKPSDENLEVDASNLYFRLSEKDLKAFNDACDKFTQQTGQEINESPMKKEKGKEFKEEKNTAEESNIPAEENPEEEF